MRKNISVVILITVLAFSMSSCKSSKTAVLSMNGTDLFEYPEVDKKPMYNHVLTNKPSKSGYISHNTKSPQIADFSLVTPTGLKPVTFRTGI